MAVQSKLMEILPKHYGCVVFTAVGSILVNQWMVFNVMRARKKYNVKYPLLYSPDNQAFNCIQRAHQSTLETYPQFLLLLMVGGLQYPRVAAVGGVVCLLGRIAYAIGYSTGDPQKRVWGSFGYVGLVALLGSTLSFAAHQLKLIKC